jgi:hypothetical protein
VGEERKELGPNPAFWISDWIESFAEERTGPWFIMGVAERQRMGSC